MPAAVPIPEGKLRNARRGLKIQKAEIKKSDNIRADRKKKNREILKRAQKHQAEYLRSEDEIRNSKIQAMENGNFFVEPEAKLAFVIRLRGLKGISPKPKKALQLLRLRQINNGIFVRLNKATIQMLKLVEPYVAWGYVDMEHVRKLIYKRGHLKINRQRSPITSHSKVEEALGRVNIICIEDLVHEIATVGPHFKEASNALWPFHMNAPKGGYESIKKHFVVGGSCGNREEFINELIERML